MSHHKLSHDGNQANQLHQEEREDKYEYAINWSKPHHRESRGTESKEIRTQVDHKWMHQIDTEAVIGKIDDGTARLRRKNPKAVFKKNEHGYSLDEYERMQVFIEETMAVA